MRVVFIVFILAIQIFAQNLIDVDSSDNNVCLKFDEKINASEIKKIESIFNNEKFGKIYAVTLSLPSNSKNQMIKKNPVMLTRISNSNGITKIVLQDLNKFDIDLDINNKSLCVKVKKQIDNKSDNNKISNNEEKNIKRYKSSANKVIMIDPGHGGKDPGSSAFDVKEKDVVLQISKKIAQALKSRGYIVKFTRSNDVFINLKNRTALANKASADLFISIHLNAAPSKQQSFLRGVETYFLSKSDKQRSLATIRKENSGDLEDINYFSQQIILNFINKEKIIFSNKLAIDLQRNILSATKRSYPIKDGGIKDGPFWVLVGAQMPAVLIEVGYITNKKDIEMMQNSSFQSNFANGVANGVDAYFAKNR